MGASSSTHTTLPAKHRRFVEEYVIDFNGTQAAIRAQFSKKSARSQASRLLTKRNIQDAIRALTMKAAEKAELSVQRVTQEIARLAFYDIGDLYDADGTPKPIHQLSPDLRAVIAGIEIHEEHEPGDGVKKPRVVITKKFKLVDKCAALLMGGRYLKMFTDKLAVSGTLTLEQAILSARRRRETLQKGTK